MALDEHRSKFKVCQWQHQDPAAAKVKQMINEQTHRDKSLEINSLRRTDTAIEQEKLEAFFEAYEDSNGPRKRVVTDALEVWFMGAHGKICPSGRREYENAS
jgi:hypothetical protein